MEGVEGVGKSGGSEGRWRKGEGVEGVGKVEGGRGGGEKWRE